MNKLPYFILSALGIVLIGHGITEAVGFDFSFGGLERSVRGKSGYSAIFFFIGGGIGMIGWSYFQIQMLEPSADREKEKQHDETHG